MKHTTSVKKIMNRNNQMLQLKTSENNNNNNNKKKVQKQRQNIKICNRSMNAPKKKIKYMKQKS